MKISEEIQELIYCVWNPSISFRLLGPMLGIAHLFNGCEAEGNAAEIRAALIAGESKN